MNSRRAGALAGLLLLATGACTNPGSPPSSSNGTETASPEARGSIAVGFLGEPPTLDPYDRRADDLTFALARPVYPSLFRWLPNGTTRPDLAAEWSRRGDLVEVTLGDAHWSDGRKISAVDVVASARRALPPSGLARLDISIGNARTIVIRNAPGDWRRRLATVAFILPEGVAGRVSGGPMEIGSVTPGFEVAYRPNAEWDGAGVLLDAVRAQFVASLDIMLKLLQRGELDAAVVPMSVNLDERLDELGLQYTEELGWESIRLQFNSSLTVPSSRRAIAGAVDRAKLIESFVRDDGRTPSDPVPANDGFLPNPLIVSAPEGDELLGMIEGAVYQRLSGRVEVRLVDVPPAKFYGEWLDSGPAHVAIGRFAGAPGRSSGSANGPFGSWPIAFVDTMIAWRDGVGGIEVNATYEGPFWNVEGWTVTAGI